MKTLLAIPLFALLLLSSCTKENTGPAGSQGPTGSTGPSGPGNIVDGTATISTWYIASSDVNPWYNYITDNNITESAIDNGAILVYLINSQNELVGLPIAEPSVPFDIYYFISLNNVEIDVNNGSTSSMPGAYTFQIAVITPGMIAAHPGVNFSNMPYQKLRATLTTVELHQALTTKAVSNSQSDLSRGY